MNALDSRTIRTIVLAAVSYAAVRWAIPEQFASETVRGAVADMIIYGAFAAAAYYRKHARGEIQRWWSK